MTPTMWVILGPIIAFIIWANVYGIYLLVRSYF
ncbi:hypothetical protein KHO57_gp039 [Mycobacterium phage Phabba]|uniref:Uncharacterized protein n=1 Tax=Mycobacterium phage Phabba TaxID=2027899 RepID=A0A249XTT3_9CAUD|nr:hypothetical protein KHO57_gp039 [Mycobacterium phage Phabba]ASZ74614.1 hypothetical protein SEA_PHABBA_39 [Mycobacterium phage Phabba]